MTLSRSRSVWLLLVFISLICARAIAVPTFYRVIYSDDPGLRDPDLGNTRADRINLLRQAYHAELIILPADEDATGRKKIEITGTDGGTFFWNRNQNGPMKINGVIWHIDPDDDPKWVIGASKDRSSNRVNPNLNPLLADKSISRKILRKYGIADIGDKWNEARFLREVVLKNRRYQRGESHIYLPDTRLGDDEDFSLKKKKVLSAEQAEVEQAVHKAMGDRGLTEKKYDNLFKDTVKLELIHRRMRAAQGNAILKIRGNSHSEGHLPKTESDWIDTYLTYMTQTKGEIERIRKQIKGTSESFAERILNLKKVEGMVLDRLLIAPTDVVSQEMVKARKEVRIHVERAKTGPTFLRVYHEGDYLTPLEIESLQAAVRRDMLSTFKEEGLEAIAFSGDFILDENGNWAAIDSNFGRQSGYSFPEEDLFTTAWYGEQYTGGKAAINQEFDRFKELPMGNQKVATLKAIRKKWKGFLKGDVAEAFWDRVLRHYRDRLIKTAQTMRKVELDKILRELKAEGLDKGSIYVEFVADILAHDPGLRVAPDLQRYIKGLDPKSESFLVSHKRARIRSRQRARRHLILIQDGKKYLVREGQSIRRDCEKCLRQLGQAG